jgi:molybdopterin-binding protein
VGSSVSFEYFATTKEQEGSETTAVVRATRVVIVL